jgi:hypothetical protein
LKLHRVILDIKKHPRQEGVKLCENYHSKDSKI